jgi:hypothetical protein
MFAVDISTPGMTCWRDVPTVNSSLLTDYGATSFSDISREERQLRKVIVMYIGAMSDFAGMDLPLTVHARG